MAKWFLFAWGLGLVLVYVVAGWFCVRALREARVETEQRRRAVIETPAFGVAQTVDVAAFARADEVTVGVFVDHIGDFEIAGGTFTTAFDVWFRWRADGIHPGETFQLVNGEITSRVKTESRDENGEHYERWRVHAKAEAAADPVRYPFSDVALSIQIEDARQDAYRVRYVADTRASGVSFEAFPRSLTMKQTLATVKYVEYASTLGHTNEAHEVRSRFGLLMLGQPQSGPTYLKNFQALFASVAIALLALFIKPIHVDPRFGLGVGAVFAAIANNISVAATMPTVHDFTFTAMIYAVGLGTIILTMIESAISLYLLDSRGLKTLYKQLDALSFTIFIVAYVTLNVVLPIAAGT
jgi:hypothetical protein